MKNPNIKYYNGLALHGWAADEQNHTVWCFESNYQSRQGTLDGLTRMIEQRDGYGVPAIVDYKIYQRTAGENYKEEAELKKVDMDNSYLTWQLEEITILRQKEEQEERERDLTAEFEFKRGMYLDELNVTFHKAYDALYSNRNKDAHSSSIAGILDRLIDAKQNTELMDDYRDYMSYRGDALTSDRECAAFLLAWCHIQNVTISDLVSQGTTQETAQDTAQETTQKTQQRTVTPFTALIDFANNNGLTVNDNGYNIWIAGETKPFRNELKKFGLKWAQKRNAWYIRKTA
jgi:hypothetical protein